MALLEEIICYTLLFRLLGIPSTPFVYIEQSIIFECLKDAINNVLVG